MSADADSLRVVEGNDPAEAFDATTVILASGMDRLTRLWTAWGICDMQSTVLGAYVECDGDMKWQGDSVAKARAIVANHCQ